MEFKHNFKQWGNCDELVRKLSRDDPVSTPTEATIDMKYKVVHLDLFLTLDVKDTNQECFLFLYQANNFSLKYQSEYVFARAFCREIFSKL